MRRLLVPLGVVFLCLRWRPCRRRRTRTNRVYEGKPLSKWAAELKNDDLKARELAVTALRMMGEGDMRVSWLP